MMQEIKMTIHMIPVAKGRAKRSRTGIAYIPKKTKDAEGNILAQAIQHKPAQPFESRVSMQVVCFMPIPASMPKRERPLADSEDMIHTKRPDLDNLLKTICDSMNGVFWKDDSLLWKINSEKRYSPNPRIEVQIYGE